MLYSFFLREFVLFSFRILVLFLNRSSVNMANLMKRMYGMVAQERECVRQLERLEAIKYILQLHSTSGMLGDRPEPQAHQEPIPMEVMLGHDPDIATAFFRMTSKMSCKIEIEPNEASETMRYWPLRNSCTHCTAEVMGRNTALDVKWINDDIVQGPATCRGQ